MGVDKCGYYGADGENLPGRAIPFEATVKASGCEKSPLRRALFGRQFPKKQWWGAIQRGVYATPRAMFITSGKTICSS